MARKKGSERCPPLTKEIIKKISDGNIEFWKNQTGEYLATDPVCVGCKVPITNFSRLGLCEGCRCYYNHLAYRMNNREHCRIYARDRKKREKEERKIKEDLFPFTGVKERREKEALTAFQKDEREEKHELEKEERRRKSAFCY